MGNLLTFTGESQQTPSQKLLDFIHSFLANALDLSRYITLSLSHDHQQGVILTPSWIISTQCHEDIISINNPYSVAHSLSITNQSSLYITLDNLPTMSLYPQSSQYSVYRPYNTSHHYYKFRSRRLKSDTTTQRKGYFYQKSPVTMQPLPTKLGDLTPNIPYAGGPPQLHGGDIVVIYGDDTESKIITVTEFKGIRNHMTLDDGERDFHFQIRSQNPGFCFVHFYIVCHANSTLSHMTPDHQSMDFYPSLLRSQLGSDLYLSHLFTLSIHVKAYESPMISSSVGTTELISIVEMALDSSIHDGIHTKEVLACSQYLLTPVCLFPPSRPPSRS